MDALILTAGYGKRLRPLTEDTPKPMIKIYGVPILERILHVLKNCSTKRVVIVIGYNGHVIKNYFGSIWNGIKIIYKKSDWYGDGILKSIIKADGLFKERFLFLCGDAIPEESLIKNMLKVEGDTVIGVKNLNKKDSVVAKVDKGIVKSIEMRGKLKDYNKSVPPMAIYSKNFFKAVKECIKNKKLDRPDAIQWMIKKGFKVNSFDVPENSLLEVDTFDDLKKVKKIIFNNVVKVRIKKSGIFKKLFNFPISIPLTKLISKTNLTPNQISLMSMILLVFAGILFSLKHFVIGGILCYSGAMLDAVDGKISRLKFKSSNFGKFFDSLLDRISEFILITGLTLGIYFLTNNYLIFLIGITCIFFIGIRFYFHRLCFNSVNEEIYNVWKKSKSSYIANISNRDLNFFIISVSSLINYPIIGLIYITFSATLTFLIMIIFILRSFNKFDLA